MRLCPWAAGDCCKLVFVGRWCSDSTLRRHGLGHRAGRGLGASLAAGEGVGRLTRRTRRTEESCSSVLPSLMPAGYKIGCDRVATGVRAHPRQEEDTRVQPCVLCFVAVRSCGGKCSKLDRYVGAMRTVPTYCDVFPAQARPAMNKQCKAAREAPLPAWGVRPPVTTRSHPVLCHAAWKKTAYSCSSVQDASSKRCRKYSDRESQSVSARVKACLVAPCRRAARSEGFVLCWEVDQLRVPWRAVPCLLTLPPGSLVTTLAPPGEGDGGDGEHLRRP